MPSDLETPDESVVEKIMVIFYDELTFRASNDQPIHNLVGNNLGLQWCIQSQKGVA